MELGARLRQARLEAGLSQRQLCGETITRNMLSQIENGAARPSMDTLMYLAKRLGKSVSFFLEEQAVVSANTAVMAAARGAFAAGDYDRVSAELSDYREPDPLFDQERQLLLSMALLRQAKAAFLAGKDRYALELLGRLEEACRGCIYWDEAMERSRLVLLASLSPDGAENLPSDDDALLARARNALGRKEYRRAGEFLDAAAVRDANWSLLRGEAFFGLGQYAQAAGHFHAAEDAFDDRAIPWLEACYKELGDYKRAYEYACKGR